jgi:PAS domain S-box-containing protein
VDGVDQARRAAAIAEAVEALMVFDERGVVLDVNEAAAELLDLPRERLVGFPPVEDLMDVVHHDGTPFSLDQFPVMRALRTGETVAPTLMGLGPAERRVWVRCSAAPLPQGGAVAMMVDVSDLVRAEEALRESEAWYRLVVDNSVDVVSVWRPDMGEVFVSPSAQRITGWTREQRRADDEWARVHPDDAPRMRALREDVVAGRVEATTVVFRARHADGEWYWHEMGVRAVRSPDGGLEVHSSVRDVTDRVTAERARRGADARWRAAFDHGPLGQALVDVDGVPLSVNEALRDLLSRDVHDDRDRSVLDAVHPDDRQAAEDLLAGAWNAGNGVVSALVRVGGAGAGDAGRRPGRALDPLERGPVEGTDGGAAYPCCRC